MQGSTPVSRTGTCKDLLSNSVLSSTRFFRELEEARISEDSSETNRESHTPP